MLTQPVFSTSGYGARLKLLCVGLVTIGFVTSAYLLYSHVVVARDGPDRIDVCSELFGTGCHEALQSPYSVQLGIPLAGWGVVFYGTVASLLILGYLFGETFKLESILSVLVLALCACVIGLGLIALMLSGASPVCPLCFVVHATNFGLVFVLYRLTGQTLAENWRVISRAFQYLGGAESSDRVGTRLRLAGFALATLTAVIAYQWVFIEVYLHGEIATIEDPTQIILEYESRHAADIPVTDADAQIGTSDALVQLVLFSDLQCPGCRRFAAVLSELISQYEDDLHIVFKHYPLSTTCNDGIKRNLHKLACEAAWAAEAARRQQAFWPLHDALFNAKLSDEVPIESVAEQVGLDMVQWRRDTASDEVRNLIKNDIALGQQLGVDATPTVFLDGRRVYDLQRPTLTRLIDHQISQYE